MEEDKVIQGCKLLIIGGSAGSLEVVLKVFSQATAIPAFAIVIVLHRKNGEDTLLEELIAIKTIIPVQQVEDKIALQPGFIHIAPSDYHLLFEKNGLLALDASEKVNYSRPSIDVSFESAADVYGSGVVAVLLSGANNDGTAGLKAIDEAGGTTIVQNPESAEMPYMPRNAMLSMSPGYVMDVAQLTKFITHLNT
jgi:two-component system chemotaxis response regulator CheB